MKLDRFLLLGAALLGMAVSCKDKDDDDDENYEYFSGSISFELPAFISPGEVYELGIGDICREDGGGFGCCWNIDILDQTDTLRREDDPTTISTDYTFTVPDTLCEVTVKATVFATGYTMTSNTATAVIVSSDKQNGSITGRSFDSAKDFVYTDTRDSKDYWCTTIGDRQWFRENLAYNGTGFPYKGSEKMEQILGRYYSWNEAREACPQGWRLPDSEDWSALAKELTGNEFGSTDTFTDIAGKLMCNVYFNGDRMWEYWPKVNVTDSSRFSAIPAGYSIRKDGDQYIFYSYSEYATFWANDTYDEDYGIYRYLYVDKTDCFAGTADKDNFLASVRCVRDAI